MFDNRRVTVDNLMGGDDDWEKVVATDSFLHIFDRLPDKMRLIVDLKTTGTSNKEIASLLKISEHTVIEHLRRAKRRFINEFLSSE